VLKVTHGIFYLLSAV